MKEETVVIEQIAVKEEGIQAQQRSPLTILSEDEGYLLEEDEPIVKTEAKVDIYTECCRQESKAEKSKKKKTKVIAMEFASVKHQGRTLEMLGEFAPGWRPKTRPRNKLRLNMKSF